MTYHRSWLIGLFRRSVGALLVGLTFMASAPFGTLASGTASFNFSSANVTISEHEIFTVNVLFSTQESVDTIRLYLSYPPDLLSLSAISAGSVFPNVSPGNSTNATTGEVSFGAFTVGSGVVENGAVVARLTMTALKAGTGVLSLSSSSLALQDGENVFSGSSSSAEVTVESAGAETPVYTTAPSSDGVTSTDTIGVSFGGTTLPVTSSTHPSADEWYAEPSITWDWTVVGREPQEYYVVFDQSAETDPRTATNPEILPGRTRSVTYVATSDGLWYLHLTFKNSAGQWLEPLVFPVKIDTTAPKNLAIEAEATQLLVGETIDLRFGAVDELSGIASYAVSFDGSNYTEATSPYSYKTLSPGDVLASVRATDKAGNNAYTSLRLRAYSEGSLAATFLQWRDKIIGRSISWSDVIPVFLIVVFFCGIIFLFVRPRK